MMRGSRTLPECGDLGVMRGSRRRTSVFPQTNVPPKSFPALLSWQRLPTTCWDPFCVWHKFSIICVTEEEESGTWKK